jgi:hypothetical protein
MTAKGKPSRTSSDATLCAWTLAELDKADRIFEQEMVEGAKLVSRSLPSRSPTESRKRHLTIGKRAEAKHRERLEQRAVEEANIEALRRLHPRLADFINSPAGKRGRPRRPIDHDQLSAEARLAEARYDRDRILVMWKRELGFNRQGLATKIAAERWGLADDDVTRDRVSSKTRERLKG